MRKELCARKECQSLYPFHQQDLQKQNKPLLGCSSAGMPINTATADLRSRAGAAQREAHWMRGLCNTADIEEVQIGKGERSGFNTLVRTRQSWGTLQEGWGSSCCWVQAQGSSTPMSRAGKECSASSAWCKKRKPFLTEFIAIEDSCFFCAIN